MLNVTRTLVVVTLLPCTILSLVSVTTHYWIVHDEGDHHQGLWKFCNEEGCYWFEADAEVKSNGVPGWHKAVLGLMVTTTLLQVVSFLCFLYVLLSKKGGWPNIFAVLFASLAWICVASGMAVYTQKFAPMVLPTTSDLHWGFSFLLGWISFVLNLCACVVALVHCVLEDSKLNERWPKRHLGTGTGVNIHIKTTVDRTNYGMQPDYT